MLAPPRQLGCRCRGQSLKLDAHSLHKSLVSTHRIRSVSLPPSLPRTASCVSGDAVNVGSPLVR